MRINEVSQRYDISVDTLRYYERIGLIEPVARENGIRNYQEEDLSRIEFILCMKDTGLSLDSLSRYFELYRQGDATLEEREALLTNQREKTLEKIEKIQASLEYLDYKIDLTRKNLKKRDEKPLEVK